MRKKQTNHSKLKHIARQCYECQRFCLNGGTCIGKESCHPCLGFKALNNKNIQHIHA